MQHRSEMTRKAQYAQIAEAKYVYAREPDEFDTIIIRDKTKYENNPSQNKIVFASKGVDEIDMLYLMLWDSIAEMFASAVDNKNTNTLIEVKFRDIQDTSGPGYDCYETANKTIRSWGKMRITYKISTEQLFLIRSM